MNISTCVKYSINTYRRYTSPRYILADFFRNLISHDYHGIASIYETPLVFLHVSPGVSTVSFGVSSVSLQSFPSFTF